MLRGVQDSSVEIPGDRFMKIDGVSGDRVHLLVAPRYLMLRRAVLHEVAASNGLRRWDKGES